MSKSLISDRRECLLCGATEALHKHHIFFGTANRKLSEAQGCWCYLCAFHHNMSKFGVHENRNLDIQLKQLCQKKWELEYGGREEFIKTYGKSYL